MSISGGAQETAKASTSHPVVHVYDSMYLLVVKVQIATILHTVNPAIALQFMDVQMQAGGYDCGLFAVAFSVSVIKFSTKHGTLPSMKHDGRRLQ